MCQIPARNRQIYAGNRQIDAPELSEKRLSSARFASWKRQKSVSGVFGLTGDNCRYLALGAEYD